MGSWQQYINIAIVVLVLGMSALSWLYRQFKIYQQTQEAKAQVQRQREQMLRTGRDEPGLGARPADDDTAGMRPSQVSAHDEARRKLIELAQRRQAQLAEMARRASAGGGGGGQGAGGVAPPRPQVQPTPRPQMRPPARQTPQEMAGTPPLARRTSTPRPVQDGRGRPSASGAPSPEELRRVANQRERAQEARRVAEQVRTRAVDAAATKEAYARSDAVDMRESAAPAEMADALTAEQQAEADIKPNIAGAIASLRMGVGTPKANVNRWRNALIMMEVLNPAVAVREMDGSGGVGRVM